MSNLLQRTITGLIFGIVVIGAIVFNEYSFAILLLVICVLGLKEFYKLSLSEANKKYSIIALVFGIAITTIFISADIFLDHPFYNLTDSFFMVVLTFGFVSFSVFDIFLNKNPKAGQVLLGLVLIPFSLILLWKFSHYGYINCMDIGKDVKPQYTYTYQLPLTLLVLTWANDVGAYFSGKFLGKRKLFERISPNKTWAGFYGGSILTIVLLFLLNERNLTGLDNLSSVSIILLSITISTFATFGDLYQSYTKRIYGVKDSGSILPGHGGIWDRFDGFFFVIYGYFFFQFTSALFF